MELLFVYGTLMQAYGDEKIHEPLSLYARYVGGASCEGKLYEISGYPGLVVPAQGKVYGELYDVHDSERLFMLLDEYEGYDSEQPAASEYIRRKIIVRTPTDGHEYEAWVYVYNWAVEVTNWIESGEYTKKGSK